MREGLFFSNRGYAFEMRQQFRQSGSKMGSIIFDRGRSILAVTMRNHSSEGALLRLHHHATVRKKFDLIIPDDDMQVSCKVVWQKENLLGVLFTSPWSCLKPGIIAATKDNDKSLTLKPTSLN